MVDRSDRRQAIRNEAIVVLHDYDTMYFYVAGGRWPFLLAGTTRLVVWPLARAPHHVRIARAASSLTVVVVVVAILLLLVVSGRQRMIYLLRLYYLLY